MWHRVIAATQQPPLDGATAPRPSAVSRLPNYENNVNSLNSQTEVDGLKVES